MKKLTLAAAIGGLMMAPAFAQVGAPPPEPAPIDEPQAAEAAAPAPTTPAPMPQAQFAPGAQTFMQAPQTAISPGNAVVVGGEVVGEDPDSDIRLQLRREALLREDAADHPL